MPATGDRDSTAAELANEPWAGVVVGDREYVLGEVEGGEEGDVESSEEGLSEVSEAEVPKLFGRTTGKL